MRLASSSGPQCLMVNARFRRQAMTGVQRYAAEICQRLQGKITELVPETASGSGLKGHLWEQVSLPRLAGKGVLWSPCNAGPVLARRHVVTIHDMAVFDVPDGFTRSFRLYYRALIPLLARRAARVLTVSEFSRNRIVELTGISPDKVSVIPNGISRALQVPQPMPDSGAEPEENPFVLAVGSMTPRKNLSGLIAAWKLLALRGECDGVQLCIVGGESRSVFGAHVASSDVDSGIRFLGRVDDGTLGSLYHRALCCVNPSFYEGFGLPVIEAFAAGCPVICSDRTAFPEVGGDAVDYFDPGDPESIAQALRLAIGRYRDPEVRRRQGEVVRGQAERFSWDRSAEQVLQILCEVGVGNG